MPSSSVINKAFKLRLRVIGVWTLFFSFIFFDWKIVNSVSPHLPHSNEAPRFYSNQLGQDLRLTMVEAIRSSKKNIHLVMFGLSDPAILNALAQQQVPKSIYFDPSGSLPIQKYIPQAELYSVKGSGLMHQKILVIDKETVFIGSANMTTSSLKMHDNLVLGMKNRRVAQFLSEKAPHTQGYLHTIVSGQRVEIWLLPDPRGHAIYECKKKIRSAKRTIQIALFTLTHPSLVEELVTAHQRGVDIHVVVDQHAARGASLKAVERLEKAGITVRFSRGIQLLHHKFMLIDDATLLTGSANWTKAAFQKNNDCIVSLNPLTLDQRRSIKSIWRKIRSESKARS